MSVDLEDFKTSWFIHKYVKSYLHARKIQTPKTVLKRGGATQGLNIIIVNTKLLFHADFKTEHS